MDTYGENRLKKVGENRKDLCKTRISKPLDSRMKSRKERIQPHREERRK